MTPQQAKTVTIIMGCIEPYLESFKWRHMPVPNKKVERLGFEFKDDKGRVVLVSLGIEPTGGEFRYEEWDVPLMEMGTALDLAKLVKMPEPFHTHLYNDYACANNKMGTGFTFYTPNATLVYTP